MIGNTLSNLISTTTILASLKLPMQFAIKATQDIECAESDGFLVDYYENPKVPSNIPPLKMHILDGLKKSGGLGDHSTDLDESLKFLGEIFRNGNLVSKLGQSFSLARPIFYVNKDYRKIAEFFGGMRRKIRNIFSIEHTPTSFNRIQGHSNFLFEKNREGNTIVWSSCSYDACDNKNSVLYNEDGKQKLVTNYVYFLYEVKLGKELVINDLNEQASKEYTKFKGGESLRTIGRYHYKDMGTTDKAMKLSDRSLNSEKFLTTYDNYVTFEPERSILRYIIVMTD